MTVQEFKNLSTYEKYQFCATSPRMDYQLENYVMLWLTHQQKETMRRRYCK